MIRLRYAQMLTHLQNINDAKVQDNIFRACLRIVPCLLRCYRHCCSSHVEPQMDPGVTQMMSQLIGGTMSKRCRPVTVEKTHQVCFIATWPSHAALQMCFKKVSAFRDAAATDLQWCMSGSQLCTCCCQHCKQSESGSAVEQPVHAGTNAEFPDS